VSRIKKQKSLSLFFSELGLLYFLLSAGAIVIMDYFINNPYKASSIRGFFFFLLSFFDTKNTYTPCSRSKKLGTILSGMSLNFSGMDGLMKGVMKVQKKNQNFLFF
jgi:hypothetical protein